MLDKDSFVIWPKNCFKVEREEEETTDLLSTSRASCPLGLPIVDLRKKSSDLSESDHVNYFIFNFVIRLDYKG